MFDFGLREWYKAPVFLPGLIENRANSMAFLLDIFQINRANCDPLLRRPSVSDPLQSRSWRWKFRKPPRVPILGFCESVMFDERSIVTRVMGGEEHRRMLKSFDQ